VPDAAVLINDGRISAVGPRQTVSRPAHVDVIDVSGLTLLPGLIDGTIISPRTAMPSRSAGWLHEPLSAVHMRTATVLRQTLATGYTTIRDAAGLDVGLSWPSKRVLIRGHA